MGSQDIHIEVSKTRKPIEHTELISKLNHLIRTFSHNVGGQVIQFTQENAPELSDYVECVTFDQDYEGQLENCNVIYHIYNAHERGPELETFVNGGDHNNEEISASNHWILPSKEFIGLWENLLYEDGLKENIMKFVETSILFGSRNVNQHIISCNRIVLLHGPPGTGKTSLCKAIAQKLSIRLLTTYKYTHLIEINSHSLFSKWFSESGKLVMKLFNSIRELLMLPKSLVCVLIDEIESLVYARSSSENEPKEALRVVNAVLTQLDQIKNFPNILILTTSNLTSSIDIAFIDRADIKQFIGFPSVKAIYDIYSSAIKELIRINIIKTNTQQIIPFNRIEPVGENGNEITRASMKLLRAAKESTGLSGRILRKLPFLAHALFCKDQSVDLDNFIDALISAIEKERYDQIKLIVKEADEKNKNN